MNHALPTEAPFAPGITPSRHAVLRQFLKLFLPLALVLSGSSWLIQLLHARIELQQLQTREGAQLEVAAQRLGRDFAMISSDLRLLAGSPVLRRYLDRPGKRSLALLAEELQVFAREKRIYDQVRYLDRRGSEVVRVNYVDGRALQVADGGLQDKGRRYYFTDTMRLERGRVFVSPLDLNIEQGTLERPFKPMVRFATPVFDSAGRKQGIVILNYLATRLVTGFRKALAGSLGQAMLLDREGYWLIAPDPADDWSRMLGGERRFPQHFPRAWRAIAVSGTGHLVTAHGLFVFHRVQPLSPFHSSSSGAVEAKAPSGRAVTSDDYVWNLVTRIPGGALPGGRLLRGPIDLAFFAVVLVLFAAGTWQLARSRVGRRLWQRALEESESRFRAVFREAGIGIALVGLDGRTQETNGALQHLLGFGEGELAGRDIGALLDPSSAPEFMSRFSDLAAGLRDYYSGELRCRRSGGVVVDTQCYVTCIRGREPGSGLALVLVEDVSERLQAEERAQRLQEQLAHLGRVSVMGEMAVILAHELSTPLSAIVNFAGGSSRRIRAGNVTPEALLEPLERINQLAMQAGEVIQRVRGFVGKDRTASGIAILRQTIDETAALLERSLWRHGVELRVQLPPKPDRVGVPKVQLQQVLVNLMLNAVEAMSVLPEGAARLLSVTAERESRDMLELTVEDSGPGVEPDRLANIFEPFHTSKPNGLGMGLAICRTLVESWGGRIRAAPGKDGGLGFRFTLPRCTEEG